MSLASDPPLILSKPALWRARPSWARVLRGGRLRDAGRLPRYFLLTLASLIGIWGPISTYLASAPPRFTSHMSLILPGSGASSSVNLANIGQASTHANSAFASSAVSPTETYKRLLSADRIKRAAATRLGMTPQAFGAPQVQLVDQTAFIHIKMTGENAEAARARNAALLAEFMAEIDRLRGDEQDTRQTGGLEAITDYRASVTRTRADIAALRETSGLHSAAQYERLLDEADALRARIDLARADHARAASAVERLEGKLGVSAQAAARILRLNGDETYLSLMEAEAAAATDLAEAEARYGRRHPNVETAAAALATARARAAARTEALTGSASLPERAGGAGRGALLTELVRQETERAGLYTQMQTLETQRLRQSAELERLAPMAASLEDLQRDFDVAEAVFASAIARTQSQRTDVYASYPLVQVLEDPTLPEKPSSPNRKLALAAGVAATVLLTVALVLGWMRSALIGALTREKKTS
ncbi:hypothetical protein [Pacificoceanicola onchidii]|uniref:hypothetical protein n=1 Tax=Pacificoceanicola onchidii TaxID=2562685 RepID=UPI0010A6A42B|nr:hypothetical protein [Pacificoceanicola onchidii]